MTIARWKDLSRSDQEALDRVWRGVDVPDASARRLIGARLATVDGGEMRLTEFGERVLFDRHASRVARRQERQQQPISAW